MRVKICGITNLDDANLCCELGADAVGFIFYEKSKRFINYESAGRIINSLPAFITKVGVFVNENIDTINASAQKIGLNAVQLHGDEKPSDIDKINLPVIKSFNISEQFDFTRLKYYGNASLLLDTYSKDQLGGTGISFDWSLIPEDLQKKTILAGGVSAANIEYIFNNIKPQAVDLSSSVESFPGKKDHTKLKEFFKIFNQLRCKTC